jgi:hypothetical protein
MSSRDENAKSVSYIETELHIDPALRFPRVDSWAMSALRETLGVLPVSPYRASQEGIDSWDSRDFEGDLEYVLQRLETLLRREFHMNEREIGAFTDTELILTNSNLRPEALHVVLRLSPKNGGEGSVLYGLRVQRTADGRYVVWSDI